MSENTITPTPGKVWLNFTRIRDGVELKFRIEEVPRDKYDDVYELFFEHFLPQEPFHKAAKLSEKAEVFEESKAGYKSMAHLLSDFQVDACYLEESGESRLVGGSLMNIGERDDSSDTMLEQYLNETKSEEMKTFLKLVVLMTKGCKIFDKFNIDSCYEGKGVVVHEDYRRLGIAREILKSRSIICKERGVPMTSAWMTAFGTQKAAEKLNWETICELEYKVLGEQGGVEFVGCPPSCKLMIYRV